MRTIFDENRHKTRTYLVYGNVNDLACPKDGILCNMEYYLVKLLKSRGYKHVIFYGGAGNRGAYCRDPESARFFFDEQNKGLEMPSFTELITSDRPAEDKASQNTAQQAQPQQTQTSPVQNTQPSSGSQVSDALSDMFDDDDDDDYSPGYLSGAAAQNNTASQPSQPVQDNGLSAQNNSQENTADNGNNDNNDNNGKKDKAKSFNVRYSFRGMELDMFMQLIKPLMGRNKNIAVVFYNAVTTSIGNPALIDNIMTTWEQTYRENCCILMFPESANNEDAVIKYLEEQRGLAAKFIYKEHLNPQNCIKIGTPGSDEIRNMLRYLSFTGTENGRKISFKYTELDSIAERIQYASGKKTAAYKTNAELAAERLREMYQRILDYAEKASLPDNKLIITPDTIDTIWNVKNEQGTALRELDRPGWENAYKKVLSVLDAAERYRKKHSAAANPDNTVSKPDIAIQRLELAQNNEGCSRPPIPNFVLLGNPGTGKTTIARLIGRVLHDAGLLKVGRVHEVKKENLTNSYVAGIPRQTMEQVDIAEEGVLFIDEAHNIAAKDGGVNNAGTGHDVVSTLNGAMTDPNHHFCVVLAGYEKQMEDLWDIDPGFKSRFGDNFIVLDDYKPELLGRILISTIEKDGYTVDKKLTEEKAVADTSYTQLGAMVDRIYAERDREKFGNARDIVSLARYAEARADLNDMVSMDSFIGGINGQIEKDYFEPQDVSASLDYILKEMDEKFVGMAGVKKELRKIGLMLESYKQRGISPDKIPLTPIIIAGNPGTGKSSLGDILPRLYFHYQLLGTSRRINVNPSELASSYQGGTQEKITDIIRKAQNTKGFIFIDEAHQLAEEKYGSEAVKAFLAPMTDRSKPFMVCFAVYPSRLKEFLAIDPGLERRVKIIRIDDYTGEELYEIFKRMARSNDLTIPQDTDIILARVFDRIYKSRDEQTGNAGKVEKVLAEICDRQRNRCYEQGIPFNSPESFVILPEDIPEELRKGISTEPELSERERCQRIIDEFSKNVIGMEGVKKELQALALELQEYSESGKDPDKIILRPMIFCGTPGVGKTLVSKWISKLYCSFGLLYDEEPVVLNASNLASSYQGGSQEIINKNIQEAQKKRACLFIDEAHELLNEHFDGRGAFRAFMAPTTDREHPFLPCFAVYPDKLEEFLNIDQGARSRFRIIRLEDYTGDELYSILQLTLDREGKHLDEETAKMLKKVFKNVYQTRNKFTGNGRFVERLYEEMDRNRRERCLAEGISFSSDKSREFTAADVPQNYRNRVSQNDDEGIERLENIRASLDRERVGAEGLKTVLYDKIDSLIYNEKYPNRQKIIEPGHYFFSGPPGTGKTTGTKFFTKYLAQLGLVQSDEPIIISASSLVAGYVGQTGIKTRERLESSVGRVLMVDEAYALVGDTDKGESFNAQAVNEIVNFLDNEVYRKTTSVIFCGYKADMDKLYKMNEGLKSRINEITFEPFSVLQSMNVLQSMLSAVKLNLDDDSMNICAQQIEALTAMHDFANGRTIRRYADLLAKRLEKRCLANDYAEDDKRTYTVLPEDIPEFSEVTASLNLKQ